MTSKGEARLTKKARKSRGNRADGNVSLDMCPDCFAFNCDPMSMSQKFRAKVRRRREAGLCGACGKKPCQCKSSLSVR